MEIIPYWQVLTPSTVIDTSSHKISWYAGVGKLAIMTKPWVARNGAVHKERHFTIPIKHFAREPQEVRNQLVDLFLLIADELSDEQRRIIS